jgi:hypothetical protein
MPSCRQDDDRQQQDEEITAHIFAATKKGTNRIPRDN